MRSERVERAATIMQQQQAQAAQQPTTSMTSETVEVDAAAQSGVIDFGHRAGLPFARNIVGDPEAPVLIVEYSDFQ